MGALAVLFMTTLWGFVGIAMPILAPKGPHHRYTLHIKSNTEFS